MCIHDRVRLAEFFPTPLTKCATDFLHLITFCIRLIFNLVSVGKQWTGPVFPHPLTSNFMFNAYSWQGKVGWVFPHPSNHMLNNFPYLIIFYIRLIFNLFRFGKVWVGPVFPHPLKCKGNICIHDRERLSVFFCRWLTICTTVLPHPITFWTRLMFSLVRVGKEWAGLVFPHPLYGKGYICIQDRVRLAVFFRRRLTICTTVFPHLKTFWTRLMLYHIRVEKEWVGAVFPPIPNKQLLVLCIFLTG